jgi:pimeloyl-ACP methyl ester carboxylesterase
VSRVNINGVDLHYDLTGNAGPTLVLVHGAWVDHTSWRLVAPVLAETHRVVRYDRRGHSLSAGPDIRHGSREQHEDDLAGLIEALDLGPVHLVGSSYGASVALAVAANRPDLVRSVFAHEPPLVGVARPESSLADSLGRVATLFALVVADLVRGQHERGAIRFIEELVLGPGSWFALPEPSRRAIIANAPTFLDLVADPDWGSVSAPADAGPAVVLSDGGVSPRWLPEIVAALLETGYRHADHHTFDRAGHAPHLTHHTEFVETVTSFVLSVDAAFAGQP